MSNNTMFQCVILFIIDVFGNYELQEIKDISNTHCKCTSIKQYIYYFIDNVKECFIRNCTDVSKIKMTVKMYDDNDTKHNFIMKVLTIIRKTQFTTKKLKQIVVIEIIEETPSGNSFIGTIGF